LFGGILFNIVFATSLAFEPRHIKNIRDKAFFTHKTPTLNDFIYPLMFATGGGIVLFVISAATLSYTCTMIALTIMLFFYACSVGGHGGVLVTKRFGNRLLYLCGLGVFAFIALLMLIPVPYNLFGYSLPSVASLIVSLVLSIGYIIFTQTARYFLSPNSKKKKPSAYSEGEEYKDSEDEYDEYEGLDDDPREDYEEYDPHDSDDGDELDEKEKINYTDERSNEDD
jgi:hypothetical protein